MRDKPISAIRVTVTTEIMAEPREATKEMTRLGLP